MRQQQFYDRMMRRRRAWYRFFRTITLLIFIATALGLGVVGGLFASVAKVLPTSEELSDIRPCAPTRILANDGSLLAKVYSENRELVPIAKMGKMVIATKAIEDIRFNAHPGIDLHGIARALVKNIIARDSKEGASTITQQLARNLYLSREKNITRKLQEIVLALELERRYSKQEILESYLNQVYYGSNSNGVRSWGVQMAARNYFGKDVDKLTLAEAALLAGLPKNPHGYNPYRSPESAKGRRDVVLGKMREYRLISAADYEKALDEPVRLAHEKTLDEMVGWHAPYFVRHILSQELPRIFGQDTRNMVYQFGVDVYTSLDPRMQKVAEDTVVAEVTRNKYRKIDDGALVAIDPKTGYVKAMVGGTDFHKDQYNIVTQGHRQPGSAFKPFVYATALLHGYTPETRVNDRVSRYPAGDGKQWTPKNSDGKYRGAMQLQQALWLSRNAVAVAVANDVGVDKVIDVAKRMGMKYTLEPYLSTALGASVVVPLEICSAYGALANGGVHHPAVGITRIATPEGDVLYEAQPNPTRALPTDVADTMQKMMRGVIDRGTGRSARCPFPASGKTGTTNSYRDAWFVGYTDDIVAAVWVGNRGNQSMNRTFGGTVPAPIWRKFMLVAQPIMADEHQKAQSVLASINTVPESSDFDRKPSVFIIKHGQKMRMSDLEPVEETTKREAVMICKTSHLRATSWCPDVISVTYDAGHPAPAGTCKIHTRASSISPTNSTASNAPSESENGVWVSVCSETGKIATSKCPSIKRKRFAPTDAPTETCPLHGD